MLCYSLSWWCSFFGALACHGHYLYHHTDVTGCLVHLSGYHRRRFTEYHLALLSLSIAIGNVVDDAIVVLENVTTHIERGSEPKQAAIHATNEVAISVIASTLTMIAVFFPLTMVSGMSGVLFRQLGWMMCAIMTVSTVSALSFTPMMCAQFLRLQKKQSKMFKLRSIRRFSVRWTVLTCGIRTG